MRIKYIEEKPVKQVLVFEDSSEWIKFFENKFNEIFNLYGMNYKDKWIYSYFKIKKNGEPANPNRNQTKKAQKNQKEGFDKYCERRKKATRERNLKRKLADIDFKIEELNKERIEIQNEN